MADDDIADRNVEQLLTQAHQPPRIDAGARARILANLSGERRAKVADVSEVEAPIAKLPERSMRATWTTAALLALAAVLALVWSTAPRGTAPTDDASSEHRVANDSARPISVALEDGSTVILRGGATIDKLGPREIRLVEGELLVDVAHDEAPFVVHTAHGRAIAVGTRFTVRNELDRALTAVVRGKVRLQTGGGEALLAAGESGWLVADAAPAKSLGERLSHTLAWAKPALVVLDAQAREPVRRGNLVARDQWSGKDWPLPMRELVVDVHVEDGIARTTIDQTFFNHMDRQLEGVYSFPLPGDAAISRLAMYVDGKLMEGGIVERERGRDVYESIVYQRRDPALLEWMKGNEFRVRIFPLPARTEKRILLSYTQPLHADYGEFRLQVPIPEIDLPVGIVDFRVRVHGADLAIASDSHALESAGDNEAFFHGERVTIGDDLLLTLRPRVATDARTVAFRDETGQYLIARAQPEVTGAPRHTARSWVVLYDTSASRRGKPLQAQAILARRFVHEMDEDDRVAFVAFDTQTRAMPGGFTRVGDVDGEALDAFFAEQSRLAAGVTNLSLGLDAAVAMLGDEPLAPHILYLGDGMVTEGTIELEPLRRRVAGTATVVAVAVDEQGDDRTLRALADASGGLAASVRPGDDLGWRAFEVLSTLNSPRVLGVRATLLDAQERPIADLDPLLSHSTIAHGQGVSVLAHSAAKTDVAIDKLRLQGTLDGAPWSQTLPLHAESRPAAYLPRLWAQAQIDAWLSEDGEAHREAITALGMRHFLITPHTSLLVLESESMYREFKVTRPTAADWAHYAAPDTIAVAYEPAGADPLGLGGKGEELILRDPLQILTTPGASDPHLFSARAGGLGLSAAPLTGARAKVDKSQFPLAKATERQDVSITLESERPSIRGTRDNKRPVEFARNIDLLTALPDVQNEGRAERRRKSASIGWGGGSGRGHRGGRYGYYESTSVPSVAALHYSGDHRLDDLTHFVPGMFADGYDYAREGLLASAIDIEHGSITDEARARVQAARSALRPAQYRLAGGGTLSIDSEGRFWRTRTTAESLEERVVYDGERVYALYPELGLAVERHIGSTSPLLLATQLPWMMPKAEHLARWYDISAVGARSLRLVPAGTTEGAFEIELDAEHRIVAIVAGHATTRFEYDASGITIRSPDGDTQLERLGSAGLFTPVDEGAWTRVELPLRTAEHWAERTADDAAAGAPPSRHALDQRMATAAALGAPMDLVAITRELLGAGFVPSLGEVALASGAARWLSDDEIDELLAGSAPPALSDSLRAAREVGNGTRLVHGFDAVAKRHREGLLGTLAAYRAALEHAEQSKTTGTADFVTHHGSSQLAYVLVTRVGQSLMWTRPADVVALWELLAKQPSWQSLAEYSAGAVRNQAGKYAEAADHFERSMDAALASGTAPIFDWQVQQAVVAGHGQASYDLLWSRWRAKASTSGDLAMRVAFVQSAAQLGRIDDAHRIVATTRSEHLRDTAVAVAFVDALIAAARNDDAWLLVTRLLDGDASKEPAVLDRAAMLSETQGRTADAADYLERAMAADAGTAVTLADLRADFGRLLGLHARLAQTPLDPQQAAVHRERALDVAARWRYEDPDNAEIDKQCASLFVDDPELAWRQLSSIIERHPAEGGAYADVAGSLEREGQLERADALWQRAVDVEPTNPTWSLRRAENLAALGDRIAATTILDEIDDGQYQERFAEVVRQAKQLRTHLLASQR